MKERFIKALTYVLFQLGLAYTRAGVGLDSRAYGEIDGELHELVVRGYIRSNEAFLIKKLINKIDEKLKSGEFKPIPTLVEEVYEEEAYG